MFRVISVEGTSSKFTVLGIELRWPISRVGLQLESYQRVHEFLPDLTS